MKNGMGIFFVVALSLSLSAQAIYDPSWERPISEAKLTRHEGQAFSYPVATQLTLNHRDGEEQATSFTLIEDTGIRCVTTPCPSFKTTEFKIVKIFDLDPQNRIYEAYAETEDGQRKLEVNEFDGFQQQWAVLLYNAEGGSQNYTGYPQGVFTIQ